MPEPSLLPPTDADAPARSRRRPWVLVGVLVVVVALLGLLLGGRALLGGLLGSPDYDGPGSGEVIVQVEAGDSARDIGETLAELGVVRSAGAFTDAAEDEARSRGLQPGYYRLKARMKAAAALALLLDPSARVRTKVTVPEGTSVEGVLDLVAKGTEITRADLQAAAANPVALGLPAWAQGRLEGFLYPATYDIEPGTDAVGALSLMVERFVEESIVLDLEAGAARLGRSPYEVVTIASMIERESRLTEEFPKVSRVVYNRLERRIPLGIDATVLYGLGRRSGGLTGADLRKDTPYNTRLRRGLPPTPIANPGSAALAAALEPAAGDWLYYVLADKDGRHLFTASYEEFLAQKARSQREGVF